ncbi:hypothetical protein AUJ67_04895 [Candidatus Desantisbacteria bacterium CG1_02_49_89]|nr:MAG: hypothetical protein AUJ67_04895 [Candidatus Desantisbacteria bacterium CG1_02_49_89]
MKKIVKLLIFFSIVMIFQNNGYGSSSSLGKAPVWNGHPWLLQTGEIAEEFKVLVWFPLTGENSDYIDPRVFYRLSVPIYMDLRWGFKNKWEIGLQFPLIGIGLNIKKQIVLEGKIVPACSIIFGGGTSGMFFLFGDEESYAKYLYLTPGISKRLFSSKEYQGICLFFSSSVGYFDSESKVGAIDLGSYRFETKADGLYYSLMGGIEIPLNFTPDLEMSLSIGVMQHYYPNGFQAKWDDDPDFTNIYTSGIDYFIGINLGKK